jgi:hypothetical protein
VQLRTEPAVSSAWFNFDRVGVLVLYVHDVSDIFLDMLKLINYLKLEGARGFFATEIAFALNLISWIYWRLYQFPLRVVRSSIVDSHVQMATHSPGDLWNNPIDP